MPQAGAGWLERGLSMSEQNGVKSDAHHEMPEEQLGPGGEGLPAIPEPHLWDSAYGLDEATAIAIVPERTLIFWELARVIEAGIDDGTEFRLTRMRLEGEVPTSEKSWPIEPVGRFQDSGLTPGAEYLWVISRVSDDCDTPLLATNPVRMPIRTTPSDTPGRPPTSIDLLKIGRCIKPGEED